MSNSRLTSVFSIEMYKLSLAQAEIIKGIGIFLIVCHNFYHNLPPKLGENQFLFNPLLVGQYLDWLQHNPTDIFNAFFSLWGHYGVELFIFMSAYGCAISLRNKPKPYLGFMQAKFNKIYLSFLICVAVYILMGIAKELLTNEQVIFWDAILLKLLLISNFFNEHLMSPVGPWWFIPFIFQLYLILPIIQKSPVRFGDKILLIISIVGLVIEYSGVWNAINFSPLGHLPLICLGIFLSNKEKINIPWWGVLGAFLVFLGGHYDERLWEISDLAVTLLMFILFKPIIYANSLKRIDVRVFYFLGGISFHLFMVNGFLRSPFKSIALKIDTWWGDILATALSFFFSLAFALGLKYIDSRLRAFFANYKKRQGNNYGNSKN